MGGNARIVNGPMQVEPMGTSNDFRNTVSSTAKAFLNDGSAVTLDDNVTHVLWSLEDASVRFTIDGSDPTTSNGHVLNAGESGIWSRRFADSVKVIRNTSTDAVFHVSQLAYR